MYEDRDAGQPDWYPEGEVANALTAYLEVVGYLLWSHSALDAYHVGLHDGGTEKWEVVS